MYWAGRFYKKRKSAAPLPLNELTAVIERMLTLDFLQVSDS